MGLWDGISNFFSGGGRDDINDAYNQANQYLDPYRRGGIANYNEMQDYNKNWGNNLNRFNNAGDYMYGQINQSPMDYYNNVMKNYSESPEAKYEQEQAMRGANNAASASGMIGSGAYTKGIQQNAADISNRDRDRYYGNVMTANNAQMNSLQNLQGQQAMQRQMLQYLTQLGYGAGTEMGQNKIGQGTALANMDRQSMEDIMSLFGMGGQGFANNYSPAVPAYRR